MLLSDRAQLNSYSFLLGWVVGLIAVGVVVLAFAAASSADDGPSSA